MAYSNIFTSDRLIFEPWDAKDEETKDFIYECLNRDLNVAATAMGEVLSPAVRSSMDASWEERISGNYFKAIVCIKPNNWNDIAGKTTKEKFRGIPIGFVAIFGIPQSQMHHRSGTLAISLGTHYQGKGYGTEALKWLASWAFQYGNLHSLRLETKSSNEKAVNAYERAGFVQEGRLREAWFWNGKWEDVTVMSILQHEWQAKQKA